MANTSPRSAWGATAYFSNNGRGTRVALLPRYRRWLRGRLHGDISAGPYLLDSHADVPARLHGGVARTSLGISDLLSLSSQFDAVRDENGRWRVRPYVGVRVGSYAAIPMTFFNFIYAAVVGEGSMRISGSPAL